MSRTWFLAVEESSTIRTLRP
ncbi:hypothetical protein D030_3396A, partial [Vibrio parahaemolyticus AQ3810]